MTNKRTPRMFHQIHQVSSRSIILGIVQEFRNERKFSLKLDSYGLVCKVVILFNWLVPLAHLLQVAIVVGFWFLEYLVLFDDDDADLFFYLFKKKFLILILNSNFGNRSLKLRSDNEKSLTKSCRRFLFENNLHGHVTCLIERNLRASLPAQCLLCLRRVTRADLLNSIKRPSKPVEPDLGSPVIFQLFRICIRDYKVRMKLFPRLKFSRYTNFV